MTPNLIWFLSLSKKELKRVFRIWKQTLVPPVISSALYFLIFWSFIGSQINNIWDVTYIQFIVPWFIMMSVINASYANVSSSFFGSKFNHSIEELLVSPMPNYLIILAYTMGGIIRWIMVWILIFLVAQPFTHISIEHFGVTLLFLILTSTLFSLAGLFNAFFAKTFDDISIIPTFVITPMVYLGWVFFSLEFLSNFWQTVSQFNPIFYMVNGLRYGMLGHSEVNVMYSILAIFIFIILLFALNLRLLNKWYWLKS